MKQNLLLLLMLLLPAFASADDSGKCGNNLTYTFEEATGTLTISGTGAMTDYSYDGYISDNPWYSYRESVKTVNIQKGVTSIGANAFVECSSLTSVSIPEGVTSIGKNAFFICSSLTSISIPEGVTSIGDYAFDACSSLISINIPEGVTSIGKGAFYFCSSLASITVAEGNTTYDSRNNCNAIIETATNTLYIGCKTTVIPSSVTSIGEESFWNCSSLTSISIPEGVTIIGNYAFYGCSSLSSISIPSSVTSIRNYAFQNCSSLTSVTSLIVEPFKINANVFQYFDSGYKFTTATLYVPMGTKEKYEATAAWNQFQNIVEIEATGVEPATATANAAEPAETYSLDGRRAAGPRKGLSIVKMSDGTVKKVMVR